MCTNHWNFCKKILRIGRVENLSFFESALLIFFLFFLFLFKSVTIYGIPRMGQTFYDYHDFQKNQGLYRIMNNTIATFNSEFIVFKSLTKPLLCSVKIPPTTLEILNPDGINYQKLGDKKRLIRDLTRPSHAIPSTQSTLHTKYSLFHDPPLNEFKPILEDFSSFCRPIFHWKYSYEDENQPKDLFGGWKVCYALTSVP